MAKLKKPVRGPWLAWPVDFDRMPGMLRFRVDSECETADAFFLRAMIFCRSYAQHGCLRPALGVIADHWSDLAVFIRWTPWKTADELRDMWRSCGLVVGEVDQLAGWEAYNGWVIGRYRADCVRKQVERDADNRESLQKARKRGRPRPTKGSGAKGEIKGKQIKGKLAKKKRDHKGS